jgi:hypothetical protein
LDASTVKFDGTMDLDVAFEYSTISDWLFTGSYSASLTAESTTGTAVANLGIRGGDDDMFDDKPRECCIDVWVLFALPTPHDGLNSYTRT